MIKRDGTPVPFTSERIAHAIAQAMHACACDDPALADELSHLVEEHLGRTCDAPQVGIEAIQDAVVHILQETGHYEVAITYARYRDDRERFRRSQRLGTDLPQQPIHLEVIDGQLRRRPWDRAWVTELLLGSYGLDDKGAHDAVMQVEASLAGSAVSEISAPLLFSLIDAALVRCGRHTQASRRSPLRVERGITRSTLAAATDGRQALEHAGRRLFEELAIAEDFPEQVVRLWCHGRLWIDGLDDPRRGSQFSATVDGLTNPWQVLATAFGLAAEAQRHWRRIRLILPPSVLGHLERGAKTLIEPITALARLAQVHLYCDGRTPLLQQWPFTGAAVSIATYHDDFLLLQRLQELGQPLLSGPHLMAGGYRRRVAVELALNAQGLEGEHAQLDALAMALASAARHRLDQLRAAPGVDLDGADLRFAIFGLPMASESSHYLERQILQEGVRQRLTLVRSANLPEDACAHLGRLLE